MPKNHTFSFDSLSEVPEIYRDTAKEIDGKFQVQVVHADDLKEYRDNNVSLMKERDSMTQTLTQYEQVTGVPLTEITEGKLEDFGKVLEELKTTKQRVDDGKLVEETSLEEAAAARVDKVRNESRGQIDALTRDRDAHKTRAEAAEAAKNEMLVENIIRTAASDSEVAMIDNAVSMVLPQALRVFKFDSDTGAVVPREADGTTKYGSDGMNPMSPKEWLLEQRESHDYLFQGAKGGGAAGSDVTSPSKMSWEQLQRLNPAQRMQMAREGKA